MTDDTEPTPGSPAWFAQGLHMSPEDRAVRAREMLQRQIALEAARQRDKLAPLPADTEEATPSRLAKAGDEVEDFVTDTGKRTRRMLDGSVLDALFSKAEKYPIDGDQYAAGRQLHNDWDMTGLGKIGVVDTTRESVDGGQLKDMTAKAIDALGRYRRAKKVLEGVRWHVLFHVVLMEDTLEEYGKTWCYHNSTKLAKVAAKEALRGALTDLAFHYFGKRQGRTVAAHEADYRPSIMGATG